MINSKTLLPIVVLTLFSLPLQADNQLSESALTQQAAAIVKSFGGTLKPKLQAGIQAGGFERAIKVCAIEAPLIASNLSAETGWNIARVSLKPRNKASATPDDFERQVLERFDQLQAEGEPLAALEYSEFVDNTFRYMKAQSTDALCLACHGEAVSAEVKQLLQEYYPEDTAMSYSLGQVRGAFSLVKVLELDE